VIFFNTTNKVNIFFKLKLDNFYYLFNKNFKQSISLTVKTDKGPNHLL